jgi:hypothetical protein
MVPVVNIQEAVVKALELAAQVLGLIQELEEFSFRNNHIYVYN